MNEKDAACNSAESGQPRSGQLESWADVAEFWRTARSLREDFPDGMFEELEEASKAYSEAVRTKVVAVSEETVNEARAALLERFNEVLADYGFSW